MADSVDQKLIASRFRGFFPVIVDVETGGVNPQTDALLEIAFVFLAINQEKKFYIKDSINYHIKPFSNARLDPSSMAIHNIDPDHPFRLAVTEAVALNESFNIIKTYQKKAFCNRCVLVGHNSWFDLHFLNAAIQRAKIKKNPFHKFTSFDTASLSALIYGQTVLSQALKAAKISFNHNESHSAIYDAKKTAELFCEIVNNTNWYWP